MFAAVINLLVVIVEQSNVLVQSEIPPQLPDLFARNSLNFHGPGTINCRKLSSTAIWTKSPLVCGKKQKFEKLKNPCCSGLVLAWDQTCISGSL